MKTSFSRRAFVVAALVSAPLISARSVSASVLKSLGLTKLLGNASDKALGKLGETDGFYRDLAVRILLPGAKGKLARKALRAGDKLGLTTKLTKSLNDAASLAAIEAKPVFRSAINQLKLSDIPGLATQKDGASQYLRRTAGVELEGKVRPLIDSALGKVGAFRQLADMNAKGGMLAALGITNERMASSVTQQAMNGIFAYMGKEEADIRANPLGKI
jgi:hypothetical protein